MHTRWLKLKYPTGQNAISRQPCEISTPKFLDLYGRDPATILNLKKYFSFLQSYGYINILCHIFNFARNNQQQLVIIIVKKHWLLSQIPKIWQVVHFSVCSKFPSPAFTPTLLVAERVKLAKHVMVSTGVCFGGKGRLHFIPDTAKVNANCML